MPRCQLAVDLVGQRQSGLENRRNRMPSFPFETGAARYSRMRTSETTAKYSEHSLLLLAVSGCILPPSLQRSEDFRDRRRLLAVCWLHLTATSASPAQLTQLDMAQPEGYDPLSWWI